MESQKLVIKNNIRFYRRLNELTCEDLAKLLGRSDRGISNIERGKAIPSLEIAFRIANLFSIPVNELFFEEGNEQEKRIVYMKK